MQAAEHSEQIDALAAFVRAHPRLFVLTGAGVSTDSGIPDYRDANGEWKHRQPVQYQDFVREPAARQRYWARALLGWRHFGNARPNPAHHVLARLERAGHVAQVVTQNVDGLHQRAGSRRIIDLHGRLDAVLCLACGSRFSRSAMQWMLVSRNPEFAALSAAQAPDGDALLERADFSAFAVPPCAACGGVLKPDVVFFGESVPRERVSGALAALEACDAMLVVGSSLMVFSGYRFAREARRLGRPIGAINVGRTRADADFSLKVAQPCALALGGLARRLGL